MHTFQFCPHEADDCLRIVYTRLHVNAKTIRKRSKAAISMCHTDSGGPGIDWSHRASVIPYFQQRQCQAIKKINKNVQNAKIKLEADKQR